MSEQYSPDGESSNSMIPNDMNANSQTTDRLPQGLPQGLPQSKPDNRQIKVLLLVISSPGAFYDDMKSIHMRHIGTHDNESIKTLFVEMDESIPEWEEEQYRITGDCLLVRGAESYLGILQKTLVGFEAALTEQFGFRFDYVVRTNLSTVFNYKLLYEQLSVMPQNNVYTGGIMMTLKWLDLRGGIVDQSLFGTQFFQGTCIVLSRDVVQSIIDNKDSVRLDIVDDVAIGLFMSTRTIENVGKLTTSINSTGTNFNRQAVVFRNRSKDRAADVFRISTLYAMTSILNRFDELKPIAAD